MRPPIGYRFLRWLSRQPSIMGALFGILTGLIGFVFLDVLIERYTCPKCGSLMVSQ